MNIKELTLYFLHHCLWVWAQPTVLAIQLDRWTTPQSCTKWMRNECQEEFQLPEVALYMLDHEQSEFEQKQNTVIKKSL